jgi:hypothetical protein
MKFLTISGSPFIRKANALGTKSLTNTYENKETKLMYKL